MQPYPNRGGLGHSDSMFSRADTNFNVDNLQPPPALGLNRGTPGYNLSVNEIGRPYTGGQQPMGGGMPGNMGQPMMQQQQQMMGGMGRQKSPDEILQAMAMKVMQQGLQMRSINDFFVAFDVHDQRQIENWELAVMFMDVITLQEADLLARTFQTRMGMESSISYPTLLSQLATKITQLPPGAPARHSVYATKVKSPQITQYLGQIQNFFRMKGLQLQHGYDQFFKSAYINQQEFQGFLMQIGLTSIQPYEVNQLFQYFLITNESMISKICFVQALKQLQQQSPPQSSHLQTITSMGTIESQGFNSIQANDPMTKLLQAIKDYMQMNNGLSFEGLLSRFNIPLTPYLETSKFEEFCLRLNMMFSPEELKNVVHQLDTDYQQKVKTQTLRARIEQFLMSSINTLSHQNTNLGIQQTPSSLLTQQQPTIQHQNSFHIQMQPIQNQNLQQQTIQPGFNQPSMSNQYQQQQSYISQPSLNQQYQQQPTNNLQFQQQPTINQFQQQPTMQHSQMRAQNMNEVNMPAVVVDIQPFLNKIKMFLQQTNLTDMRKLFTISFYQNKEVVELQEFLNFLQAPYLQFTSIQAYQIAQIFLLGSHIGYQKQQYIDIEGFENKVFAGVQTVLSQYQEQHNSYQTLSKMYETIRKYIIINGGNIQKFFMESDINRDNFISKAELKIALEKIGCVGITDNELNQIYMLFDDNKDGRISYQELCKQFSEFSNTKAIKDPQHWAFYIFESIRRASTISQQSLSQLFGLNSLKLTSLSEKIPISKDQFFQALSRLNIPLTADYEKKLLELLDADQAHQWEINFSHFAELVGLHYQPVEYEKMADNYQKNPLTQRAFDHTKKFYRQLYFVTQNRNLTINNLKMVFRACDMMNQGTISLQDFAGKLQEIDVERKLDLSLVQEVAQRFQAQNGMFNYIDFLSKLGFELEKFKIVNLIFITLKSAMLKLNLHQLYELFQKFDQSGGMRIFDKTMLSQILLTLGINLSQYELDMVILEYDPSGSGLKLDFNLFESDFKEFQQGSSQLNAFVDKRGLQYNDFQNYIGGSQPHQSIGQNPPIQRQATTLIKEILRKIGAYLDSHHNIKFTQLLMEHDITKSGILNISNFQNILQRGLLVSSEETSHLIYHYDPNSRQQIKIQDFLAEVKDYVTDTAKRLEIMAVITELGSTQASGASGVHQGANILQRYAKDFEDIQKAIIIRKSDTYRWFQSYASLGGKQAITRNDFRAAMNALGLTYMKPTDIDSFFDAFDPQSTGQADIYAIDEAIRRNSKLTLPQMQEEILVKLVKGFNGDDAYILKELVALDPSGRGILDIPIFVNFLMRNAPPHLQFSQNDLQFLAMKYANPNSMNPNLVDVNTFHDEFKRTRQQNGMQPGYYSGNHVGMGQIGRQPDFHDGGNTIGPGHRNPLMPHFSGKNTVSEKQGAYPPPNFKLNMDYQLLGDLAKGTYMREQLVQDYFSQMAQKQQGMEIIQEADFSRGIQMLNINWTSQTANQVFTAIDIAFNGAGRRLHVTPQWIDQCVNWFCPSKPFLFIFVESIEDLHQDILKIIAQYATSKSINLRGELGNLDRGSQKQISVDNLKDLLLNHCRIPQLNQFDIQFLSKRYIINIPNQVQYEKFLDDLDILSKQSFSQVGNFKNICDYLWKATLVNKTTVEAHFRTFMRQQNLLIPAEFLQGCTSLQLVPDVCDVTNIDQLFNDIDSAHNGRLTLEQLSQYIARFKNRTTKELQDEIIQDVATKAKAKSLMIDTIFKQDDPVPKGVVPLQAFTVIVQRNFQVKQIDAKLLALRYQERGDSINYKMFQNDVNTKMKDAGIGMGSNVVGGTGIQDCSYKGDTPIQQRLKQLLVRVNDFVVQNRLQLATVMSQYERGMSTGTIPQQQFLQVLDQMNIPIANEEKYFISENYMIHSAHSSGQQAQIDYRKFLEDMKLYASQTQTVKSVQSLTKEQSDFYKNLINHMKSNNKQAGIVESIQERDSMHKGYLSERLLIDVFTRNGYNFNTKQSNIMLSALDTNTSGEYNIKQLYEILFGAQEAQRLFQGGSVAGGRQPPQQSVAFVMPNQTMGAANGMLASIGKKLIQSNINYEEEFKKKIGHQQASSPVPKATEMEILDVLQTCKVNLSNDERIEFQALILNKKDQMNQISVLEFLQALGLPPQTLGTRGMKSLPKRILQPNELKLAQSIIFKLRDYLNQNIQGPNDIMQKCKGIFEKCKSSMQDLSIPMIKFKLTLASEFGTLGKQITDDQVALLTYYLTQEVPGEVSYKKLYLAFTMTERDPPLSQQGADDIKRYETRLREQAKQGVPLEILDLLHFLRESGVTMAQVFKSTQKGIISRQEFETSLKDIGFQAKDPLKLIEVLDAKGTRTSVSLDKLNEFIRKASPENRQITPQIARDRYQGFDPKVRQYLQKISDYMKRSNISLQKMYEEMDVNRDGTVDKMEFVSKLSYLNIPGIQLSDLGMIFDAIDINNDNSLSVLEFGMFIEGAKATRMQRLQDLDPKIMEDMKREIQTLFQQFDANGDGFVTADEIFKSMLALGQRITIEEAQQMIKQIDNNGDGKLDMREFTELMMPKMKDELLNQEDSLEDLRAMFLDADIDHSGTLSVDEIYSVLLKIGAEVTMEELVELMNEIDVDRNGALDIDEFVALMNMGDDIQFRSTQAKNTFINIKRARKLNPLDFFKCFKNMPMNFVPSFFTEQWVKKRRNLPSSVFMPQIDPKTMLYKDLFPLLSENIAPNQTSKALQPRLRPLITELGCQILLEEAQGVPIPASGSGFERNQIVKRAVRVGLYDTVKKDFIFNVMQVNAIYNQVDEDMWSFNAWKDNGTNPVLFKTAQKDEMVKPNIFLIFEMVVYVKVGEKVTEMSCGWCQLDMHLLDRNMTHKLPIKGGSPNAEVLIKDTDVHTNRTGMKYLIKVMGQKISSQLTVSIRGQAKFTEETKFHLDLLPATCLVQKRLLYFVSGFRNYLGEKFLKQSSMASFKQPEGDVIISTFPKILDNPDICEQLIAIWSEDVWASLNNQQKHNIDLILVKTKEFIQKLYPVIYADEFGFKESNTTMSAAGDQYLMRKREELVKSALRFGNAQAKVKVDKPIELLTTFKPFTVKELEFEVWDTAQAKQDRFMKQYEDLGLLGNAPDNAMGQGFGQQQTILGGGQMGSGLIGGGGAIQPLNLNQPPQQQYGQSRSLGSALNNAFGQ